MGLSTTILACTAHLMGANAPVSPFADVTVLTQDLVTGRVVMLLEPDVEPAPGFARLLDGYAVLVATPVDVIDAEEERLRFATAHANRAAVGCISFAPEATHVSPGVRILLNSAPLTEPFVHPLPAAMDAPAFLKEPSIPGLGPLPPFAPDRFGVVLATLPCSFTELVAVFLPPPAFPFSLLIQVLGPPFLALLAQALAISRPPLPFLLQLPGSPVIGVRHKAPPFLPHIRRTLKGVRGRYPWI
jgi:hypothetical protein